jgi:hypothetical protein
MYSIDRVVVLDMLWSSLLRTAGYKSRINIGLQLWICRGSRARCTYTGFKSTASDVSWIAFGVLANVRNLQPRRN